MTKDKNKIDSNRILAEGYDVWVLIGYSKQMQRQKSKKNKRSLNKEM